MKKVLSLCLALMLCACILPVTAFAASSRVTVNGFTLNEATPYYFADENGENGVATSTDTVTGKVCMASLTVPAVGDERTLTLNNYIGGSISWEDDLTIVLQGNATIETNNGAAILSGALTISSTNINNRLVATSTGVNSCVIQSGGAMTITGCTVIAAGGNYGIECNGTLSIENSTVSATGSDAVGISTRGNASIINSTVTAAGNNKGICIGDSRTDYSITISGSTITTIATDGIGQALYAGSEPTLTNVTVTGSTGTSLNATLTDVTWNTVAHTYKIGNADAKIVKFAPAAPVPTPAPSYSYSAPEVTLYNNPVPADADITLSGYGLTAGDQLVTDPITYGSNYKAMLGLAGTNGVIGCYDIHLKSGAKVNGSAMTLSFDLDASYAGQACTLIHKKADGSLEYFYSTVDANGRISFGPLYELSPFMLAKGTLPAKQLNPETGANDLVGLAAAASLIALLGATACACTRKK